MNTACETRVFIVDDSPAITERLQEIVESIAGATVCGKAATPAEAIAGILETRPACALLDYQLDGGTCVDVLDAVRSLVPQTLFIVLTNHSGSAHRRICMSAGADHFFDKSTEFERMTEIIRSLRQSAN